MKWLDNWIKKQADTIFEKEKEAGKPEFQRVVSDEAEKYKNSKEPWVTIIGDTISEDGIQLALDWNDAFVKYLRTQGVTGADETQIVQHWLAMISKQTADKLGQHYNDLEGKMSEYQ